MPESIIGTPILVDKKITHNSYIIAVDVLGSSGIFSINKRVGENFIDQVLADHYGKHFTSPNVLDPNKKYKIIGSFYDFTDEQAARYVEDNGQNCWYNYYDSTAGNRYTKTSAKDSLASKLMACNVDVTRPIQIIEQI